MSKKPKKAQKPSQHLTAIVHTLEEHPEGMSTGELANALGLSTSHAREVLSAEVKRGHLRRDEVEDDGVTIFKFFNVEGTPKSDEMSDLLETADDVATIEQIDGAPNNKPVKEAKRKPRNKSPTSGRGNPEAKKAINPQQTLEDKKTITKELGGTMTWAGRKWHMKGPDFDVSMTSREIASFNLEQFRQKLEG